MRLGIMFAGQGAQHPGMGAELAQRSAAAAHVYEEADRILGWSLSGLCFQGPAEELTACAHCQPAIFVTSMAAYAAHRAEAPAEEEVVVMGGLSLGELAAVTASGAVDFETGLKMVVRRGELMDECCRATHGGMAAILGCDEAKLVEICQAEGVHIANYNCPGQRVISGEAPRVASAVKALAEFSLNAVVLNVAGAYHSPLMQAAADGFREFLAGIPFQEPAVPLVHNVTGGWTKEAACDLKELLSRQISSAVHWEECAGKMMGVSEALLEMGPGRVLGGLLKRINRKFPVQSTNL